MLESGTDGPFQLLSVSPASPIHDLESAAGLFEGLADRISELGLMPIIERIYADPRALPALRAARSEAFAHFGLPAVGEPTWICNPLGGGGILDNIQLLGVALQHDWTWQRLEGDCSGSMVCAPDFRVLGLSDLCGSVGQPAGLAIRAMLEGSEAALKRHDFHFQDVTRTWLYVADLVDWYEALNDTRNDLFRRWGIGGGVGGSPPPASTGIQGFHPAGAPCFMELLAVEGKNGARPFRPLRPNKQCEAWDYGSAFSRGMVIELADQRLVTVSGTASIDNDGNSTFPGDAERQILATVANVEDLLSLEGLNLESTVWQTLYFKDMETWACWRTLEESGAVPELHGPRVVADGCRSESLFEMEATVLF